MSQLVFEIPVTQKNFRLFVEMALALKIAQRYSWTINGCPVRQKRFDSFYAALGQLLKKFKQANPGELVLFWSKCPDPLGVIRVFKRKWADCDLLVGLSELVDSQSLQSSAHTKKHRQRG